jgi:DNA modification methylase
MTQNYKNIYFTDAPGKNSKQRNITVAFGPSESALHDIAKGLSSEQLRTLVGHQSYQVLKQAARDAGIKISSYVKSKLCTALDSMQERAPYQLQQLTLGGFFDPALATSRGGSHEPLYGWFPYLEGFSPGFVKHVLSQYAPTARTILDPFSGSGTTAITVAQLGLLGIYCEVNPLLNFVTMVKGSVLGLGSDERVNLGDAVKELARQVCTWRKAYVADEFLRKAYGRLFGDSNYFPDDQLENILIARTALDDLCRRDLAVGQVAIVACVSCLLKSSKLIRRGDVRFKNDEEARTPVSDFFTEVESKLKIMADDILAVATAHGQILHLSDDVKTLARLPADEIDAVITSPPYLNGTNYIRNTKIELWFLRILEAGEDLRRFRTKTITSGINDVNEDRLVSMDLPKEIKELTALLKNKAYDERIARMVTGYFTDIENAFHGILKHLKRGASVIVDIGDSEYAGIHVPTHQLLDGLLRRMGLARVSAETLRQRRSRGGKALTQTLLVYRVKGRINGRDGRISGFSPDSKNAWRKFKLNLPHQSGDMARRNWGHPLHSLCSYQGKMKPALAATLVETFLPANGRLLDPFAGVGTIPFEAALAGHEAFGFDISPVAIPICQAKLEIANPFEAEHLIDQLENEITIGTISDRDLEMASKIRFNSPLPEYFSPKTMREILIVRGYFRKSLPKTASEALVFSALLHILHGNRPYALSRNSHPLTPFAPSGAFEYRPLIPRLREKVRRSLSIDRGLRFTPGKVFPQDATHPWPIAVDMLDAVITSPPFFDSLRFHLGNWMRLWFAGWDLEDFQTRPRNFVDDLQKISFEVYDPIFRQAKERLRAGGVLVMHLGKSKKCDMAEELARRAKRWFRAADLFNETVAHCESHGVRDKGTVSEHQYLVLV